MEAITTPVLALYSINAALKNFKENDIAYCAISKDSSNHNGLEFAHVKCRKLLPHNKTCWLSLFPGITRLIEMFLPVKSFLLSQEHPPIIIKQLFENAISEIYFWHMHSLISIFHTHIQIVE